MPSVLVKRPFLHQGKTTYPGQQLLLTKYQAIALVRSGRVEYTKAIGPSETKVDAPTPQPVPSKSEPEADATEAPVEAQPAEATADVEDAPKPTPRRKRKKRTKAKGGS